jgi:hypothetical protein
MATASALPQAFSGSLRMNRTVSSYPEMTRHTPAL